MRNFGGVLLFSGFFIAVAGALGAAENNRPRSFEPMDVFKLEWADQPVFSPDESEIVFARKSVDVQSDKVRSALWRYRLKDGALRPLLVKGDPQRPVFSPDGKSLAYMSAGQLMLRWQDTSVSVKIADGAQQFSFSPNGDWLAFSKFVTRDTRKGAELPTPPKGAKWGDPVKVIDRLNHRADGSGDLEIGETQLFVVPVQGGFARQLSTGAFEHDGFAWRADSAALFVSANRRADAEYVPEDSEIYQLKLADTDMDQLTDQRGPDNVLAASLDGRYLLYSSYLQRNQFHQRAQLMLLDLKTKEKREIAPDFDRDVSEAHFSAGSKSLIVAYDDQGVSKVAELSLTGKMRPRVSGVGGADIGRPYGSGAFAVSKSGKIAYSAGTPTRPADLAIQSSSQPARMLTDLNSAALAGISLGKVEDISTKSSFDGKNIQGWLIYPPNFDASKKYPLLLEIHGGPVQNYGPRFSPELQLYAAKGYVVLYTNPRGSDSYGEAFANAIHHDYPNHDFDDLMSSVDATIAKGFIDEQRLFVTGGSGGGVLTAWIVGHTDRFKAAVVAKPVINWMSFVLTSDGVALFHRNWFPGLPWEPEHTENYLKRSPLMHVGKVKTPTMVIVGEADLRTPVSESMQYYHALKLRKVPTQLVLIPGASHSISARPSHMLAQVLNTIAWFERAH